MIQKSMRRSVLLSAVILALTVPAVYASAQAKGTTKPTSTSTTGTATPQGVTGGDPAPILWPPSGLMTSSMQ